MWIGGIINQTLVNNKGYSDFTSLSTPLTQGSTVYGYLSAFLTYGLTENYSIWIDYNHDNDFTDAGEQVVNISSDFMGYIAVNFTVPANALPGPTRMRVMMRYGSTPVPCGLYSRGETEDYSVEIVTPASQGLPLEDNELNFTDDIIAIPPKLCLTDPTLSGLRWPGMTPNYIVRQCLWINSKVVFT